MSDKIHRTTISLPAELKARMDAVKVPVNWSALAARAFEAKLWEIEMASKNKVSKEDVVKRMKALKEREDEEDVAEGKEAGREWAEREASPRELRRLDSWRGRLGIDWCEVLHGHRSRGPGLPYLLYAELHPEDGDDSGTADDFWEGVLGEDEAKQIWDPEFLIGFVAGALEVWSEVKGEL
jgi:hypothetical protein